ncbi:MAG TPA: hypothetical protein VES65_11420 [Solirubrobacteraceae bacterium]|nr:hypothetical protein [Solirubrobacteraceae bacterium]
MSTANWLTLLGTLVAIAATWGGLLVRVRVAEGAVKRLEASRERQGERIGVLEERVAAIEGATGAHVGRARTRTRPVPVTDSTPDESGETPTDPLRR